MLNAELKSMNSILTYKSFFVQMCEGWVEGSGERLDRYANWKGSREGGRTDLRIGVSATGR